MSFLPVLTQNEEQFSLQPMLNGHSAEAEQAKWKVFFSAPSQEGVTLVLLDELQHLTSISRMRSKGPLCATAAMPSAAANLTGCSAHIRASAQPYTFFSNPRSDLVCPIHGPRDPTSPQSHPLQPSDIKGWINPLDAVGLFFFQESFCYILCNIYLLKALMLAAVLALLRCRMAAHTPNCTPGYSTKRKCSRKRKKKKL